MNPVSSDPVAVQQKKRSRRERIVIIPLFISLVVVAVYAKAESHRAHLLQAEIVRLQNHRTPGPMIEETVATPTSSMQAGDHQEQTPSSSASYPVTLISENGKRVLLDGKALQIDLGGNRLFEVILTRQQNGLLNMWAPARREDSYFNRVVFHPHCSNSYSLELVRVELKSDSADAIRFLK
jgi:hypothetical protein